MLNLGRIHERTCEGMTRREMLQVGSCSALGLALPRLWSVPAEASAPAVRAKSVLLFWLWGGPSHHETWDPKPHAPLKIRGCYQPCYPRTAGTFTYRATENQGLKLAQPRTTPGTRSRLPIRYLRDIWCMVTAVFDPDGGKTAIYVDGRLSAERQRTDGALGAVDVYPL